MNLRENDKGEQNQIPDKPGELGSCILEWIQVMSQMGKTILKGVALGLGMPENWFETTICKAPTETLGIIHYPPPDLSSLAPGEHPGWGVGEHTDYGLITLLAQDDCGGL